MNTLCKRIASLTLVWTVLFLSPFFSALFPVLAQQEEQKVVPLPPKDWPKPVADTPIIGYLLVDQLEYRANRGTDTVNWEIQGWLGGDYNKLWLKATDGEAEISGEKGGDFQGQLLYSRLISPFFYFQIGGRYDRVWGGGSQHSRGLGVIGFQGLAPYWFDIEPALFISQDGDVSARLEAEYELLLTQRLILQPRFEANVAVQDAKRFGVGKGLNNIELGLRLRYEIRRQFAPYIGVNWTRLFGDTADLARREGSKVSIPAFVVGLRMWW
jgi:copper resistance protein B